MKKSKIKFIVGSLIIVVSIVFLIFTGISNTSVYFFTVSELADNMETASNEGVRVNGKVVPGSINKYASNLKVDFKITDSKKDVLIQYEGIIPDMFKEDIDVVVEGRFDKNGYFKATTLLTSCPSKYVAEKKENIY